MIGVSLGLPRKTGGGGGGGGGGGATLLVYDSMTNDGVTQVKLINHAPDIDNLGTGWSDEPGEGFQVQVADYLSFGHKNNGAYFDVGAGNLPIIMEAAINSGVNSAFTARWIDTNNQWLLFVSPGSTLKLYERTGGSLTLRAESAVNFTGSTFWLADDGETITFGQDRGAAEGTVSNTTHNTSYKYGFRGQTPGRADNFILMGGTTDPADLYTP